MQELRRSKIIPMSNTYWQSEGKFHLMANSIPTLIYCRVRYSYNNTVKLFDTRKLASAITEVDVGGGAWRIKWHPSAERRNDLLVASMHDGFKVIRFEPGNDNTDWTRFFGSSQIISRNDDHESMAYGADWAYSGPLANGNTIIGGCSFYDHKMSIWSA